VDGVEVSAADFSTGLSERAAGGMGCRRGDLRGAAAMDWRVVNGPP